MKKIIKISALLLALVLTLGAFTACSLDSLKPQSKLIIGKWVDTSALNSGYEFKEDGKVTITYANFDIPVINQTFNGTVEGIYTLEKSDDKNIVNISFTILLQSITKTYEYSVKDGILTLTDLDNGNSTVLKQGDPAAQQSE